MDKEKTDFLIIGAGIIGLSLARELNKLYPKKSITIIEKEAEPAYHASGRNSGVLHAGFYYTENSLKAKFTRDGNRQLTEYCDKNGLSINKCKKVVVAKNEDELKSLFELEKRGNLNNVEIKIITANELKEFEPNARTYKYALYSPTTSTVDPVEICRHIRLCLEKDGVLFKFNTKYKSRIDSQTIATNKSLIEADRIINASGLYADKIAHDFGFGQDFTIIPFKGIYLKYTFPDSPIKTNIYPVPNLKNPFLGVHYTITVDNTIKIGPTAIPAFWRENYSGINNFKGTELLQILYQESKLFLKNTFGFRTLAFDEIRKYNKKYFINLARDMVYSINNTGFTKWSTPGIRAQLLNTKTNELVQDFIVEGDKKSIHILNAVSPAFTSSFPFARWVVENYIKQEYDYTE